MPPPPPPPPPHRPPTTPSSSATAPTHCHSPPINFLRAPSDIHPAPPPFAPCRLQPAPGTTVYRTYVSACALQTVALMPGHCCCHCCYLCCFLVPSQISPLLLLLLRLVLHLLDSRYCSLAPLSLACAFPFLYRGCWTASSSHVFTFPFLCKGLSYTFIHLFQFSSFSKFTFHTYWKFLFSVKFGLCSLSRLRVSFLVAHGWWHFSLSVLSDFLISFLFFFVIFSLCRFSPRWLFFVFLTIFIFIRYIISLSFYLFPSLYYANISLLFEFLYSFPFSSTDFCLRSFDTYLFSLS